VPYLPIRQLPTGISISNQAILSIETHDDDVEGFAGGLQYY